MGISEWATTSAAVLAVIVPAILFLFERSDRKAAQAHAAAVSDREFSFLLQERNEMREQLERAPAEGLFAWPETRDAPGIRIVNTTDFPVAEIMLDVITYAEGVSSPRRLLYSVVMMPPKASNFYTESDLLQFDDLGRHHAEWKPNLLFLREMRFTDKNGITWKRVFETSMAASTLEKIDRRDPWGQLPDKDSNSAETKSA